MRYARTRDDQVVIAVYCSEKCARMAVEPRYGAPWPVAPSEDLSGTVCPCGKAL